MSKHIDISGQRFGRLVAISRDRVRMGSYWLFKCDCGKTSSVLKCNLSHTRSCGCIRREQVIKRLTTHGKSGTSVDRTYRIWCSMLNRCRNPNNYSYKHYGGRGIKVCKAWLKFEAFSDWVKTSNYSPKLELDRRNNDKGYSPSNCRWVTHKENCQNRSNSRRRE